MLHHYHARGFTLILLGDVEELWEQGFKSIERAHRDVLFLEGSFPAERYFRLWGNHDDEWMSHRRVMKLLAPYMPGARVYEAIRFGVSKSGVELGVLLLLHGHQGRFASDKMRGISRAVVRTFRFLQRFTPIGKTTPAKDACLRGSHDAAMYRWASSRDKLVLIAGHTHRPVWSSRTHLQKLEAELELLKRDPTVTVHELDAKRLEVERRRAKDPPCRASTKT